MVRAVLSLRGISRDCLDRRTISVDNPSGGWKVPGWWDPIYQWSAECLSIFIQLLDFDNAVIVLSAVWGAGMVSLYLVVILDLNLMSSVGIVGAFINGILDLTLFIQSFLWTGLALVGLVQVGIVATN